MKNIPVLTGSLLASVLVLAPLAAFAQTSVVDGGVSVTATPVTTSVSASATTNASATTGTKSEVKAAAQETKSKAHADTEINRRLTNLNALSSRIGEMKNLSASEKSTLQANLSSEIGEMDGLKTTIDGDTDSAKLKTDVQSITKDYRVYMLVLPQGRIEASADRIDNLVTDMQALSVKLSARLSAAQSAGKNVSAGQTAYTDMQAKIADAHTQSQAALTEIANLSPDKGDATIEASNKAALKDAAAKMKVATSDLKAARADVKTILSVLKSVHVSGTATTTVTAH